MFWFLRCKAVRSSCFASPQRRRGGSWLFMLRTIWSMSFFCQWFEAAVHRSNARIGSKPKSKLLPVRSVFPSTVYLSNKGNSVNSRPCRNFFPETRTLVVSNRIDLTTSAFFLYIQLAEDAFGITHALSLSYPLAVDDTNTSQTNRTDLLKNTGNVLNLT